MIRRLTSRVLMGSDPDRVRGLLRSGLERWRARGRRREREGEGALNPARIAFRRRTLAALAAGARVFAEICAERLIRLPLPGDGIDRSFAAAEGLALGAMAVRVSAGRKAWIDFARGAFAEASDATLARYALPEAAMTLAESDPDRVRTLLRSERARWGKIRARLSRKHRLSMATISAYLGDAEGV